MRALLAKHKGEGAALEMHFFDFLKQGWF